MRVLKSHNSYKCRPQVAKDVKYFETVKYKYDCLMLEMDILYIMGKVRICHTKSYNPLKWLGIVGTSGKWHGDPCEYVRKASEAGIKYIYIEAKEVNFAIYDCVFELALKYTGMSFLLSNNLPIYLCDHNDNIYYYADFIAQHNVTTVDLY